MIEDALIGFLTAQASVSSIVGNRVFYAVAMETAQRPLIVLARQSGAPLTAKDGPTGDAKATFDVVCFGATADSALRLGYAASTALNGFRGVMGDVAEVSTTVTDEKDGFDYASGVFIRTVAILVWYSA